MEWLGLVFLLCSTSGHLGPVLSASNSHHGSGDVIPVKGRGSNPASEHEGPQPYFDQNVLRNVTAVATQTTFLHCRVKDLGIKAVSWIRQRDLHILTAGLFTYTSDQRFSVVQRPVLDHASSMDGATSDWILQIKFVQPRDAGIYECQVSTEPRMSQDFHLSVVESRAKMVGPSEVYVKQGSTLSLTCLVTQAVENAAIFWYRDLHVIDDSSVRPVRIDLHFDAATATLTSRLRITNVQPANSGNYTCLPTAADPASAIVHVINGEHPAAMQHGNTAALAQYRPSMVHLQLVMIISLTFSLTVSSCYR